MSTALKGDAVYYPIQGINIDSNGILMRPTEAVDCVNMDITGNKIVPRYGTIHLDPFTSGLPQPTNDVIHYHSFLLPGGSSMLFGFTADNIYQYEQSVGWTSCVDTALFGGQTFDQWCTTDFVDLTHGSTVVVCGSRYTQPNDAEDGGTNRVLLFYNRATSEFEALSINTYFPVVDEDTSVLAPVAVYPYRYLNNMLFTCMDYDKWVEGSGGAEYIALTIAFVTGAQLAPVLAVALYTDSIGGTATSEISEAHAATITITGDFTSFSTKVIEDAINAHPTIQYLVIASNGSTTDNAAALPATELWAGVSGIVSGTLVNNEGTTADFVKLAPNSFSLKTANGTVATSGAEIYEIGGVDCYKLLPVDVTKVAFGEGSYVTVDGTVWNITFTTAEYGGLTLFADYEYEKAGTYYPKVVQVFRNALMFANTYEDSVYYPWRIRHTEPGNMMATKYYYYTDLVVSDSSGIRAMKPAGTAYYNILGTYLYVYKDHSIVRGSYDPELFITYDTAFDGGMYAHRTIQNVDGVQYFLGINDIYAFDGVKKTSLTFDAELNGSRVREWMMDILDPIILKNTFAVYDRFRKRYILFIKRRNETYPTNALCYDVERRLWTRYVFPETSAAICTSLALSFSTIDSLSGTIDELAGTIDELGGVVASEVTIFAMTQASYVAYEGTNEDKVHSVDDTNVPKQHMLITRDFLFSSLEEAERISLMKFEAQGESVNVRFSTEYDNTVATCTPIPDHEFFPLTERFRTYFYNIDIQTDKIRFCFFSTRPFSLRWMQVFAVQTQEITEG